MKFWERWLLKLLWWRGRKRVAEKIKIPAKYWWLKYLILAIIKLAEILKDAPVEVMGLTTGAIVAWQGAEDRGAPRKNPLLSKKNGLTVLQIAYMIYMASQGGSGW